MSNMLPPNLLKCIWYIAYIYIYICFFWMNTWTEQTNNIRNRIKKWLRQTLFLRFDNNLLVQQHVLRRIWDVPQSWRWRRPRGRFLLIFFSFWDGIRTVNHSDYIFRLLECNQGCDLLEMILYIYCVDAKRILISLIQGFQYFGMHFQPSRSLIGNSLNGERIMTNWRLSQVKTSLRVLSIFNQLICIWCQKCL